MSIAGNLADARAKLIGDLEKEIRDNERWMREVLSDFKIPFDDHKVGRRLAFTRWMAEHHEDAYATSQTIDAAQPNVLASLLATELRRQKLNRAVFTGDDFSVTVKLKRP